MENLMAMQPIGYLRSVFQYKNGTPRQPSLCSTARGSLTVEKNVFNNPDHALEGLEEFSHAWILFVFHKNKPGHSKAKVKPPRLNGKRVGVFSTRSPYRPNAIGLTLAKIEHISGATVHFSGVDIVDGTPVLDIKPFIPEYDVPECRADCAVDESMQFDNSSEGCLSSNPAGEDNDHGDDDGGDFGRQKQISVGDLSGRNTREAATECEEHTTPNLSGLEAGICDHKQKGNRFCCDMDAGKRPLSYCPDISGRSRLRGRINSSCCGYARTRITHKKHSSECDHVQTSLTSLGLQSQDKSTDSREATSGRPDTSATSTCAAVPSLDSSCSESNQAESDQGKKVNKNDFENQTESSVSSCNQEKNDSENNSKTSVSSCIQEKNDFENNAKTLVSVCKQEEKNSLQQTAVAQWLTSPPVSKLEVSFTSRAEEQLHNFVERSKTASGDANSAFRLDFLTDERELRAAIVSVLSEDPRSVYRREKCADSLYFFTVDRAHVTCWFDDSRAEVLRVQPLSLAAKLATADK